MPVEHSRVHAQEATAIVDAHSGDTHEALEESAGAPDEAPFDADGGKLHHGSAGHDADLHFVALGLFSPTTDGLLTRKGERCFGNCLNLVGPVLPRDPDPERI